MEQLKNNTKSRHWEQISYKTRLKIEILLKKGCSIKTIAEQTGYSRRTIQRELKRGKVITKRTKYDEIAALIPKMKREFREIVEYSADAGQLEHEKAGQCKGKQLKIGNNHALAAYLEDKVGKDGMSPYAALEQAKIDKMPFAGLICVKTFYNYLDQNLFLNISNKDLWIKRKPKKRKYHRVRPAYNNLKGRSIEERPEEVKQRTGYGHWEMDTVVGKGKTTLLVLTERKTRKEIIRKIPSRSQIEIERTLNRIERKIGTKSFRKEFKTITSDNGSEFLDQKAIEQSCISKRKRTIMYYCHPYSAWERGSNENANKLIRRFIPKGANIADYSEKEIERIEHYINNYPRRILGGAPPRMARV